MKPERNHDRHPAPGSGRREVPILRAYFRQCEVAGGAPPREQCDRLSIRVSSSGVAVRCVGSEVAWFRNFRETPGGLLRDGRGLTYLRSL
jgi:hypothetical protein